MTVLSITGIVCKLIGVLYSIPLVGIIGADGMGIFQSVFPAYNLLLTLSSAGLPVAVSRMVSHHLAKEQPADAKRIFVVALQLLTVIGLFFSLMMYLSTPLLVARVGDPQTDLGFRAIAPCVAIVCMLSAFRGYLQGHQNMVPTAVSQLIEQVGKVLISLPLAAIGTRTDLAHGAAGALLGITVVEALALLYMVALYLRSRSDCGKPAQPENSRTISRQLMTISIPITISACIVPLAQFVDSAMLVDRMVVSGLTRAVARPLYGVFSGLVIRLINIPTALALAVAMSLVPAIAAARAVNDEKAVARQSSLGIRYAFLIGFPCAIGMSLLSHQMIHFFYAGKLNAEHMRIAGELLSVSSLTVVLFTVVQATSGILQGLHKQKIPMYTLVLGVGLKILLNYILVAIPGINIHGGPIASIVCYTASMIPNLLAVCKHAHLRFDWMGWIVRPMLATLMMGLVVLLLRTLLPIGRLYTILEVAVGAAVYAAAAIAIRAMSKDEIKRLLPGRKSST